MGQRFLTERLQGFGTTIFAEMTSLAAATGAVNLGQGFPDTDGPDEVLSAAASAVGRDSGFNQYPPGIGIASLRQAIVEHQERFYGLRFEPDSEVLVTAGATEAIAASLLALLGPGDEVIVFEPLYDSYAACIAMAGAQRRTIVLRAPDYSFDPAGLSACVNSRTRAILLNTPHNPTGKVFTAAELQSIAAVAIEHDLVVISDEVYEHLVFDGPHIPIATLPGMGERTVTISSGGKTFSVTGWKIGWVCAPAALVSAVRTVKQFLTYVNGGPFQPAIAAGLRLPDSYFARYTADMAVKRALICEGLSDAGFKVHPPQGTFFVTVDIRPLGFDDGEVFCRSLPDRCGVVGIPSVVFYDDKAEGRPLVRFAFCKRPEVLAEAVTRLRRLAS
jgi:N-succinyldiaminopimelate aminotransferase